MVTKTKTIIMSKKFNYLLIILFISIGIVTVVINYVPRKNVFQKQYSYQQFMQLIEEHDVKDVLFQNNTLYGHTLRNEAFVVNLPKQIDPQFVPELIQNGVEVSAKF